MSMAIQRAKYTGDPGFFDFLKKAATVGTSFIPFVGPTISQAISRIGSSGPGIGPVNGAIYTRPGYTLAQERARCGPGMTYAGREGCIAAPINLPFAGPPGVGIPLAFGGRLGFGENGARMAGANGVMDLKGYHPNKSSYFLMSGEFVPAGSRMVKNRKRNPANARATSRAISRIGGAKTYAKSLGRISIRKKC